MNTEKRIDICCVAKNENLTIKDWVDYHLNIGFNHIWIYDNNDPDDNSLCDILENEIGENRVTVFPLFKGKRSFQLVAYNLFLCLNQYSGIYDWVGFIDCDEYFDFNRKKYSNVSEYFNEVENRCDNVGALYVNWEIYGDNGNYFYEDKPVVDRFNEPIKEKIPFWAGDDENKHIKSFVKSGYDANYDWNPHNCMVKNANAYNCDFSLCNQKFPWDQFYTFENAKLKHFQTKSLEEYILRKFNSICADNHLNKPYDLKYYWHRNKKTPEALKALSVLCKKYKIKLDEV